MTNFRKIAHDSGDGETIYHCPFCLHGATKYLTPEGLKSFEETVGTTQKVLSAESHSRTAGRWVEAHIHEFGEQPLMELVVRRNKRTKTILATPEHRWLVKSGAGRAINRDVLTRDLKPTMRLSSLRPEGVGAVLPNEDGIRHGIVFGDGSAQGKYASVSLWGEKDKQLLRYFPDRKYKDVNTADRVLGTGVSGVHVTGNLWAWMKALPESDDQSYLYGFLAGYFAADGTVSKQGQVIIHSANLAHLEAVRDIAMGLGISTYDISMKMRVGFVGREPSALYGLEFVGSTLSEGFFLTEQHRDRWMLRDYAYERFGWSVVSVRPTGRVEKVYCAVVPETHSFALEGNIWTGNCGSGQVLARSDGTVECEFCHTAFTVQVQPEMPAFPQTINGVPVDVPGMPGEVGTDATGGTSPDPLDPNGNLPGAEGDEAPGGSPMDPNASGGDDSGDDSGDSSDSGDNPFSKNSFRTATGAVLNAQDYAFHLALKFAKDEEERQSILSFIRASRES